MTSALLRIPSPNEIELARLQIELDSRRSELERLETERDILEIALTRFAAEVRVRIGDVKDEIRRIRRQLEAMRQQTARLRADPAATPADVERAVAEEMEQSETRTGGEFTEATNGRGRPNLPARPSRSSETGAEVLRLYRELAKRHHPDLARTPAERERRAKIIHAEGEYLAAEKLAMAAELIQHQPAAITLRYLQTLVEIGSEKNTTVVFPLPIDIVPVLRKVIKDAVQPEQ